MYLDTWLICAAQNMKNIAIKNDKVGKKPLTLPSYIKDLIKLFLKMLITNKKQKKTNSSFLKLWVCLHSETRFI